MILNQTNLMIICQISKYAVFDLFEFFSGNFLAHDEILKKNKIANVKISLYRSGSKP